MSRFLLVYLGGEPPPTAEQGQRQFARYQAWLAELGAAVVSPANPIKDTHRVLPDGSVAQGTGTAMSGYTIVEADSIDAALAMARRCPFLDIGGTLEVSELMQMPCGDGAASG